MMSFGERLERHSGLGPGFDFLRVALAVLIVAAHALLLTGNRSDVAPLRMLEYSLLPMFFALSGFLVTASATRLSLGNFLINRSLRIAPALAVDILFCALILGPIVTTAPLADYLTDPRFWRYFANIFGVVHYRLPGVFETQIDPRVNGALWTVPWEIVCYVVMSILMVSGLLKYPRIFLIGIVLYISVGIAAQHLPLAERLPTPLGLLLTKVAVGRGSQLVTAFLIGVLFFQRRGRIPYSRAMLALCVLILLCAGVLLSGTAVKEPDNRLILLPVITYITIFLGLTRIPIPPWFRRGDYSYGIYLYHVPLLHLLIAAFPGLVLIPSYGAGILFLLGLPVVLLFAAGSWHLVERPVLRLRKRFSFVARARGIDMGESAVSAPAPLPTDAPALAGASARSRS